MLLESLHLGRHEYSISYLFEKRMEKINDRSKLRRDKIPGEMLSDLLIAICIEKSLVKCIETQELAHLDCLLHRDEDPHF